MLCVIVSVDGDGGCGAIVVGLITVPCGRTVADAVSLKCLCKKSNAFSESIAMWLVDSNPALARISSNSFLEILPVWQISQTHSYLNLTKLCG